MRQNAKKHGLYSDPDRFRVDLPSSAIEVFDQQVAEICVAEQITETLDRELVVSFVTAAWMEREARDYLLSRGVVTAEEWRSIPVRTPEGELNVIELDDTVGEKTKSPVVNRSLIGIYGSLVRMKRDLHAQLRTNTGRTGDSTAGLARDGLRRLFGMHEEESDKE